MPLIYGDFKRADLLQPGDKFELDRQLLTVITVDFLSTNPNFPTSVVLQVDAARGRQACDLHDEMLVQMVEQPGGRQFDWDNLDQSLIDDPDGDPIAKLHSRLARFSRK